MRIVVNAVTARMGGALSHLRNVVKAWKSASRDHDIWILASPVHVEELGSLSLPSNIHLLSPGASLHSSASAFIWTYVSLPSLIKRLQAEVLVSMHNLAPRINMCPTVLLVSNALYFSRIYEREIRGLDSRLYWDMRLRRLLVKQSMSAADVVVTPTEALKEEILRMCKLERERIRVAPWGVDSSIFRTRKRESTSIDGKANLLYVSHHAPHKGFPVLVEACRLLREADQADFGLTLTISENENRPHSDRTVAMIRDLDLIDRVQIVGRKPQAETPRLYAAADIFVFPSYCESFGLPLVEAMASGLPILAADIPNNREICGPAAVYFSPFDHQALADLLGNVIVNGSLRNSLSIAGVERSEKFSWLRTAGSLLDLATSIKA